MPTLYIRQSIGGHDELIRGHDPYEGMTFRASDSSNLFLLALAEFCQSSPSTSTLAPLNFALVTDATRPSSLHRQAVYPLLSQP
jgi:hypothetical protein